MKKLDLNFKVPQFSTSANPEKLNDFEIVRNWISNIIERAVNKPDAAGKVTDSATMDTQRKYIKIMDAIDKSKDNGEMVKLEDDDFNWLDKKFHEAQFPSQENISRLLIAIEDALNTTKLHKGIPD